MGNKSLPASLLIRIRYRSEGKSHPPSMSQFPAQSDSPLFLNSYRVDGEKGESSKCIISAWEMWPFIFREGSCPEFGRKLDFNPVAP